MTDKSPEEDVLVSVLIPVYNEERLIREVVERMQRQDVAGRVELLFVDGRSTDTTRAILERLAEQDERITVLDNPARHTAAGLNVALQYARGRYIARMDAHTLYPSNYLAAGIARLERGDVAWVCGPQVPHGRGRWSNRVAAALGSRLGVGASNRFATAGEDPLEEMELDTGVFTGIWERVVLERHGGWDEGWPINQDSELASRMLAGGERIVSRQELGALYVPRDSLHSLARQYFRYGVYRAKTLRRHPSSLRGSMLLPPGLVLTTALALAPTSSHSAWLPRLGIGLYLVVVGRESARLCRSWERPREAWGVAAVFSLMHGAWGGGFLVGLVRWYTRQPPPVQLAWSGEQAAHPDSRDNAAATETSTGI